MKEHAINHNSNAAMMQLINEEFQACMENYLGEGNDAPSAVPPSPRATPDEKQSPDTIVPIEPRAVIYDELKGETKLMNDLTSLVKENDFRCDSISSLIPFIFSNGFELSCNRHRYTYEIEDKGGHWIVTVK